MFLEFLPEFLHGICFVRIDFLNFSFGFDFFCRVSFKVPLVCLELLGFPICEQHVCLRACVGVLPLPSSY